MLGNKAVQFNFFCAFNFFLNTLKNLHSLFQVFRWVGTTTWGAHRMISWLVALSCGSQPLEKVSLTIRTILKTHYFDIPGTESYFKCIIIFHQ